MVVGHFYIFYTSRADFSLRGLCARLPILLINQKDIRRWIVTAGVIAGVALVFLLLVYLVYALIHAEAF